MRVLVTGGAGFIGSHIVDLLRAEGHAPVVVDDLSTGSRDNLSDSVPLHVVDIRDRAALAEVFEQVRPQWVSHQAAQMSVSRSVREPLFDAEVNVIGLLHVLELSQQHGVERFVFASSGGVLYGDVFEPAPEDHPAAPISPYGITKRVGEDYLRFFAHEHGMKAVALRYSNVYGPRQNPHGEAGVVAIFSKKMLAGEQATIHGDGEHVRDYVYVDDVARANLLALAAELAEPFTALNIGTGVGTTTNQLAARIRECCQSCWADAGRDGEVPAAQHGPPRAGDLRSNLVSPKRAGQLLGWEPKTPLAEGLERTVRWFWERRG
ncbi:MAG: NAD-dependent epimerase/dehydratase family protein [Planctomycetes bacterium]|nr:NAD-dependent epimerase/dehydratase family protein [Planctomycetota bacterium]